MCLKPHIAVCKLTSLGSADEQSDEDEAMEVNEEESTHESDELVMSDDETPMQMLPHQSHALQASPNDDTFDDSEDEERAASRSLFVKLNAMAD